MSSNKIVHRRQKTRVVLVKPINFPRYVHNLKQVRDKPISVLQSKMKKKTTIYYYILLSHDQ